MTNVDQEIYNVRLDGVLETVEELYERLLDGDNQKHAELLAEDFKDSFTLFSQAERQDALKSINTWLDTNANGLGETIRDLIGIKKANYEPENDPRDTIISECLQKASTLDEGKGRDDLIAAAAAVVSGMNPLARDRWRKEFSRIVGVGQRVFDALLQSSSRPTEGEDKEHTPTDDELAEEWKSNHPHTVYGIGEWRRYDSGSWKVIQGEMIESEIQKVMVLNKKNGIRPTASKLSSIERLSRSINPVSNEVWDADPDYLVCSNGTLKISTLEIIDHSPKHYSTTKLGFDYAPAAECPNFDYALKSSVPDAYDFLQEFSGYALTTDTKFEIAVWICGPMGSGKSTFVEGIRAMLGERVCTLGLGDIERSSFALTNLPGRTLAVSTEQPSGMISTSHILNSIISGETIRVDRKFKEAVEIRPRAKIIWTMNDIPRIDSGNGLFRRVKVVRFPMRKESDRNPDIKKNILSEGAGILNWALAGLKRLQDRGHFDIPDCVLNATKDFEETNDVEAAYMSERLARGEQYSIQSSALYTDYKQWCSDTGHKHKSSTTVARDWQRLGLERYESRGKRFWRGASTLENALF